jgi:RHS repeat-associated protein
MAAVADFLKGTVTSAFEKLVKPAGLVPATALVLLNLAFIYPTAKADELGWAVSYSKLASGWQLVVLTALILAIGLLLQGAAVAVISVLQGYAWRNTPLGRYLESRQRAKLVELRRKLANAQATYPGQAAISYAHDDDERLLSVTSDAQTTTYGYDEAANLRTTTLPAGNGYVETRTYDRAGRLIDVENKQGATTLSKFAITPDPVGNPLSVVRTGALAQTQTYEYDNMDRLTSVCFQAGNCQGGSDRFIRWTYDGVGNRLTESRPTDTTSYTYNVADELTQAGPTSYTYDQNGNELTAGSGSFTYDLANRLKTTTLGSTTATYAYDGDGKRVETAGGGTPAAPALRTPCSTAIGTSGSATVNKPTGTVAGDLLVVGLAFEKGSDVTITPPSGWTLIRRTNQSSNVGYATYRKTAGASEPSSYSFFFVGNEPKWSIGSCAIAGAHATAPIDVQADASGVSGNPSAPSVATTGPSRLVLAFYANKKPATYSSYTPPAVERWDAPNPPGGLPSNALASYEQPAAGATGAKTATVGEQAEWVAQQIAIAPGPSITRFRWDVNQGLPQLALERDANNNLIRRYVYGARRISQTAGGDTSYFLHDGLGSVANLTSSSGATQWTWSYEPFGAIRTEQKASGAQPDNFHRFAGEYLDSTGLYHLRARQYDPGLGRFISRDPVVPDLRVPYVSTYAYVGNRPTLLLDPSGLEWCWKACEVWDTVNSGVDTGLQQAGQFIADHNVDIALAAGTVVCVAVANAAAPACFAIGAAAFSTGLTRAAVESGVIGSGSANYCQFALSAGASVATFGGGAAVSQLWKPFYVASQWDRRILRASTEFIGGATDQLAGAGATGLCASDSIGSTPGTGQSIGSHHGK